MHELEQRLEKDEERCATLPTKENLEALQTTKIEFEKEFDYIVQGSIIRSRATWYKKGEKNNKYFLNIENSKKKKSSVRRLVLKNNMTSSNPKAIMDELKYFFLISLQQQIRGRY